VTGRGKPGQPDFVGKRFDSIHAALEAVAKSFHGAAMEWP